MKKYMYVANWKMFFSHKDTCAWLDAHAQVLSLFYPYVVICTSHESLAYATTCTKNTFILGAQDCSEFNLGAHTGQICAQSLSELGCHYCIVGHSEQRMCLTNEKIFNKLMQLQQHNIIPIL